MALEVKRGEMYLADLNGTTGSEQYGIRPVLIIQNDVGNMFSPTVVVAAVTGVKKKGYMPTHVQIPAGRGLEEASVAMLEQIRTIDKRRIGEYLCALDECAMERIDQAIEVSLGLTAKKKREEIMLLTLCGTCAQSFYDTE